MWGSEESWVRCCVCLPYQLSAWMVWVLNGPLDLWRISPKQTHFEFKIGPSSLFQVALVVVLPPGSGFFPHRFEPRNQPPKTPRTRTSHFGLRLTAGGVVQVEAFLFSEEGPRRLSPGGAHCSGPAVPRIESGGPKGKVRFLLCFLLLDGGRPHMKAKSRYGWCLQVGFGPLSVGWDEKPR